MPRKKKASHAPPSPQQPPASPSVGEQANPFELAAVVSDRVEIEDVRILRCSGEIDPDADLETLELRIVGQVSVTYAIDRARSLIHVRPEFWLLGSTQGAEAGAQAPEEALKISCGLELTYKAESLADLDEANLEAFSELNGVYNAWPYWREYVQNLVARMGLPRLVVPVFRFGH